MSKTYSRTGWLFKKPFKGKLAKGKLNKFRSDRIKTGTVTDTPLARIRSESPNKTGEGAAVLYRDHVKSYGTPKNNFSDIREGSSNSRLVPQTILTLANYVNFKDEDKPPLLKVLEQRLKPEMRVLNGRRLEVLNWNHYVPRNEPYYKLVCCFSGNIAFFVEHDDIRATLKMSRDYSTERAREIVQGKLWKRITWFHIQELPR